MAGAPIKHNGLDYVLTNGAATTTTNCSTGDVTTTTNCSTGDVISAWYRLSLWSLYKK